MIARITQIAVVLLAVSVSAFGADAELDARVKGLVHEVAIPSATPGKSERFDGKQATIFKELQAIGEPAVPYIIRYMDDRRPLPFDYIALRNPAGHFEGIRQYAPKQVVDGLEGVLNQLTGYGGGYIYSGGTDRARDEAVALWRQWCALRWPELAAICSGPK